MPRNGAADRGILRLYRARLILDGDAGSRLAHLQAQIDAQRLIDFESIGRPGDSLAESCCLGGHFVISDGKLEYLVETLVVRCGLFTDLSPEVSYSDRGARNQRTTCVRHVSSYFAGGVLSPSSGRQEQCPHDDREKKEFVHFDSP